MSQPPAPPGAAREDPDARATMLVGRFILRARRIGEHSLLQDAMFDRWRKGSVELSLAGAGESTIRFLVPPEEALESLAGRVRPLLLTSDPLSHQKVTKALGQMVRKDPELTEAVKQVKKGWASITGDRTSLMGWSTSSSAPNEDVQGQQISDLMLAYAWLYGDLVHGEDPQTTAGGNGINPRYRAAALLVCQAARLAQATASIAYEAQKRGLLHIPDAIFTEPVTASAVQEFTLLMTASGPPNTPVEELVATMNQAAATGIDADQTAPHPGPT